MPPPLMISTVLPTEEQVAWRDSQLSSALLRREQVDWAHATKRNVKLDIALADLPDDDRTITVSTDPVAMADTVDDCLSHGWSALRELLKKIEEHQVEALTLLVYEKAQAAVYEIVEQLEEIEKRAREIVLDRLKTSKEQVTAARLTFLGGPRNRPTLQPGPHLVALRSMLTDIAPLNKKIESKRSSLGSHWNIVKDSPDLWHTLDDPVRRLRAHELQRAERVQQVTQYWPLAAWLVEVDPAISDADLLERILEELETITDAIKSVRGDVLIEGRWPTNDGSTRLNIGSGLTNPFTRNMPSPRGPWRFPMVIDAAMQELGHLAPSSVYVAAKSVSTGSDEYNGLSHLMTGTVLAVSLAAPPVGVALGVAMSLWNLFSDLSDYKARKDAHRAVLDPALSLAVPPSIRQVAASVIGLVGSAVPGAAAALAFGAAETVVRIAPDRTP